MIYEIKRAQIKINNGIVYYCLYIITGLFNLPQVKFRLNNFKKIIDAIKKNISI